MNGVITYHLCHRFFPDVSIKYRRQNVVILEISLVSAVCPLSDSIHFRSSGSTRLNNRYMPEVFTAHLSYHLLKCSRKISIIIINPEVFVVLRLEQHYHEIPAADDSECHICG